MDDKRQEGGADPRAPPLDLLPAAARLPQRLQRGALSSGHDWDRLFFW